VEFHRDEIEKDVVILTADRTIDSFTGASVIDNLLQAVEKDVSKIIVDCSALGYMSSIGLTTLVRLHKRVAERGGQVKLAHVAPPLARLLAITRLQQVFPSYESVEAAREAFQAGDAAV
jgi:anti-anti-sigma factor